LPSGPSADTRVDLNKDGIPDGVLQDTIARGDPSKHGFFPFQGTSMATPHVAAAAALVISTGVTDPDRVEAVLKASAKKLNDPKRYGAGGLDAAAAVTKAQHDHAGWSLGIGGVLAALAIARSRRRDGLLRARSGLSLVGGLVLGASGLFFLKDVGLGSSRIVDILSSPLVMWPGALNTTALEASFLIALAPISLLLGVKKLRPLLAGFAFGVAGFLVARGVLGSVDVAWVPGHGMFDAAWLLANGAVAAVLGRLSLRD
jgi:serine protease